MSFISAKDLRVIFAQPYYSGFQGNFTTTSGSPILTATVSHIPDFTNNSITDSHSAVNVGSRLDVDNFDNGNYPYVVSVNGTSITMSEAATGSGSATATSGFGDFWSGYNVGQSFDVSRFFNDMSLSRSFDPQETTTFQTGDAKSYIAGLKDGQMSLSGFYDGSLDGVDAILTEATNTAYAKAFDPTYYPQIYGKTQGQNLYQGVVVFPTGGDAGYPVPCYMANGIVAKHDLKSPFNGVVAVDTEIQASGGIHRGIGEQSTFTSDSRSVPLVFATNSYDAAYSSEGGTVIFGLTESGGGWWFDSTDIVSLNTWFPPVLVEFQHSDDNASWITLDAFWSDNAARITEITTTIYRYTRLQVTLFPANGDKPFTYAKTYYGFTRH